MMDPLILPPDPYCISNLGLIWNGDLHTKCQLFYTLVHTCKSLECLICSVLKNWSFELVLAYWYLPQNIDGETVKYFCKWHGHVDDDVFARITFRKRWWEIPTRAAFIAPVVVGGPDVCFDVFKSVRCRCKTSWPRNVFTHTQVTNVNVLYNC